MRRSRLGSALVALVLSCLLATVLLGQQKPTFRSGVDIVAVDVRVVDGAGRPVADLRPDDFVVTVDGTPRTIVTADYLSYPMTTVAAAGPTSAAESAVLPPPVSSNESSSERGRTVVLVMDEENIRAGYGKWAGDAAGRFVDRMQPDDRIGLLIPRSKIRVTPTTDHAAVKAGLSRVVGHMAHFQGKTPSEACDAAYGKLTPPDQPGVRISGPPPFDGGAKAAVDDMRDRAINTLRSLVVLLESLQAEPGPKTIVLVSEELPVCDQVSAQADFKHEYVRVSEAAARARAMLYVMQLDRPVADAEDPQRSADNLRAQPSRDAGIRSLGLETVVSVTGGRRLLVSGIPDGPLARIALEISGQYVLGVRTEPRDRDGKVHSIKVTVKRKGVDVRARQTFAYSVDAPTVTSKNPAGSVRPTTSEPSNRRPAVPGEQTIAPVSDPGSAPTVRPADVPATVAASSLNEVLRRVSQYVAAYGAQAAMFVGRETYDQRLDAWPKPRRLLSEFAIVKAGSGSTWVGYRDVIMVDDKAVVDRQDRLLRLLSASSVDAGQLKQINDESARYNIGPISRNFNVPTTVLFFFGPDTINRFSFERKAASEIEGVLTWELEFKETRHPTLVRTRAGRDVPCKGRIWVVPGDGTVVRTRLELRNFADQQEAQAPVTARSDTSAPPTSTRSLVGAAQPAVEAARPQMASPGVESTTSRMESLALIEVTYRLDQRSKAWLPVTMSELYEGALPVAGGGTPRQGRTTGLAEYSEFRRFETSGRVVTPK